MTTPTISAIVCTHNRASLLATALESLCQQALTPDTFEIVIVNNGSTDDTDTVVQDLQATYRHHNIKLLWEPELGLGRARNSGWQNASGEYVAYLDDDARASPNWLASVLNAYQEIHPTPMCVGGPILSYYTVSRPVWFKEEYERRTWGDAPRFLNAGESFNGSNMTWLKSVLQKYGGFDVDKGVKGDLLSLGEETGLFRRIWECEPSPTFYYSPTITVQHLVASNKLNVRYYVKRAFVGGQIQARFSVEEEAMTWAQRIARSGKELRPLLKENYRMLIQRDQYEYWQNWIMDFRRTLFMRLGYICGLLGITPRIRQ